MNIERALATPGWMDLSELVYLAHLASKSSAIAEVGSWQGRSARAFADNTKGHIWCCDLWSDEQTMFEFSKNHADTIGTKITRIRAASVEGARIMAEEGKTFDLVFIDAGHEYEDVKADILAWRPLLREGGVLCGHDLYADGPYWPGVLQAVNELVVNYSVIGTIWTAK
jgi:predicted O-methyltransferase YrrM